MKKGRVLASLMVAIMLISTLNTPSVYMAATKDDSSTKQVFAEQNVVEDEDIYEYRKQLNYRDDFNMNFDFSFEDEVKTDFDRNWGTLPESYSSSAYVDWTFEKVNNYITPVKNQNPNGVCWAYSTIASAESSYIINEGIIDAESVDFNEYHLVHYTYDTPADLLGLFGGDRNSLSEDESFLMAGGSNMMTVGVLANWIGVSDSSNFSADDVEGNNSDAFGYDAAAHLENAYYIAMPDMTSDDYEADMNVVKSVLMKYGAMAVSYYSDEIGGSEFDGYYYYPTEHGTNHAVTLVGWDDTIPAESFNTTAPGDGAWLIKNSWGEYGEFDGYFWLSYYDESLNNEAYVYDVVSADNYDNNYQYDGSSATSYMGYVNSSVFANAFVADSEETLEAVGFYTYDVNMGYEVRVYKNLEENEAPQYGDLVLTQKGTTTYAGFHTIELDTSVNLDENERYAVVVTISKDGSSCYVVLDRSIDYGWMQFESYAKEGESYFGYSIDSLQDLNIGYTEYAEGMNVRLKAYTNEGSSTAIASGTCGDNLNWTLSNDNVLTISGSGAMWEFYSGTHKMPWVNYIDQIKSVVIQEGVTSIGAGAFWGSLSIENVVFADTITLIDNYAFKDCKKLKNFTLPEGVTYLGEGCFAECDSLTELTIPDSVATYGGGLAEWCDNLEYIYIGGNENVPSATFADTLFRACPALEEIVVSEENIVLKSVDGVLYSKDGKDLIQYPAGKMDASYEVLATTVSINNFAFQGAVNLETVTIPEGVLSIGVEAFSYCEALLSLTIPSSVVSLGGWMLSWATNIQVVNNMSSIEFVLPAIEGKHWENTSGETITSITSGIAICLDGETGEEADDNIGQCGDNVNWMLNDDGVLFIYGTGDMWSFYSGDVGYCECPWLEYKDEIVKVVFGEGVTSVANGAFVQYPNLETVEFADSITTIGVAAFRYCSKLKNVDLPENLKVLRQDAFSYCNSITEFYIPETVEFLDGIVCAYCPNLEYVYIGADPSMKAFINGECLFSGCESLTEIEVEEGHIALYSEDGVLYTGDKLLVYPAGKIDEEYQIIDGTKKIATEAFLFARNLQKVVLPDGLEEIRAQAFYGCEALEMFVVPASVTKIESHPLGYCTALGIVVNNSKCELRLPTSASLTWTDLEGNTITTIKNGIALSSTGNYVQETGVTLNHTTATLKTGETLQLSATVLPSNAAIKMVTYTSSDESIATVDENGLVKVNTTGKAGTVVITATTATTKKTATCTIVVESEKEDVSIITQPVSKLIKVGEKAVFTVEAKGDGLTYQWQYSKSNGISWANSNSEGAKTATLVIEGKLTRDGQMYRCIITDSEGNKVISSAVKLTVKEELTIITNPSNQSVKVGEKAVFTVAAGGKGLTYQWQYSKDNGVIWKNSGMQGAKTATIYVDGRADRNGQLYRCVVTDSEGNQVITIAAKLMVTEAKEELTIITNPSNQSVKIGEKAVFTVAAKGEGLTYQWQYSKSNGAAWANSSSEGAKTATLIIEGKLSTDGRLYRCIITDSEGNQVITSAVKLTVTEAKEELDIITNPENQSVKIGEKAVFTVAAKGEGLTYQWQYSKSNGAAWANSSSEGAKTATLVIEGKLSTDGRLYRCIITDSEGNQVITSAVKLTVTEVKEELEIIANPENQSVKVGEKAVFTVVAKGEGLTYQWQYSKSNGVSWASSSAEGAKTATLVIEGKLTRDGQLYRCIITDCEGKQIISDVAELVIIE